MERKKLSGWSLVGLAIIILILLLLFPALTVFLLLLAILAMIIGGLITALAGGMTPEEIPDPEEDE